MIISLMKSFKDMIKYSNIALASHVKNFEVSMQINTHMGG